MGWLMVTLGVLYWLGEVFAVPLMVRGYAQIAEPANTSPSLQVDGAQKLNGMNTENP